MLTDALRSGVSVADFWGMTPRETFAVIEAAVWIETMQQQQRVQMAWLTARLMRAKRIPSLKSLLARKTVRPLRGAERQARRREFKRMASAANIAAINAHVQKQKKGRK